MAIEGALEMFREGSEGCKRGKLCSVMLNGQFFEHFYVLYFVLFILAILVTQQGLGKEYPITASDQVYAGSVWITAIVSVDQLENPHQTSLNKSYLP